MLKLGFHFITIDKCIRDELMIHIYTKNINVHFPLSLHVKAKTAPGNSHGTLRMLIVFVNQRCLLTKRLSFDGPILGEEECG